MDDISCLCLSSLKPELFFVKLLQKVEAVYLEELIQVLPFHQIFTELYGFHSRHLTMHIVGKPMNFNRSILPEVFWKTGVFRNFAKVHGKTPVPEVLSCEFCGISKNTFFTEHPWWLLQLGGSSYGVKPLIVWSQSVDLGQLIILFIEIA